MKDSVAYFDFTGCRWPTDWLDDLLSDPPVLTLVEEGMRVGAEAPGRFPCIFTVREWAERRYRRPEAAALLTVLVWRLIDLRYDTSAEGEAA